MEERSRSRYAGSQSVWDMETAPVLTTSHRNAHSLSNVLKSIGSFNRNNDGPRYARKYGRPSWHFMHKASIPHAVRSAPCSLLAGCADQRQRLHGMRCCVNLDWSGPKTTHTLPIFHVCRRDKLTFRIRQSYLQSTASGNRKNTNSGTLRTPAEDGCPLHSCKVPINFGS